MAYENRIPIIRAFDEDMAYTSRFDGLVMNIVAPFSMSKASRDQDMKQATDFCCTQRLIASRVRRYGFADQFGYQFTVRSERANGVETELSKIMAGYGDWLFYGHVDQEDRNIYLWYIIDLHIFRREIADRAPHRWDVVYNRDGKTAFRAYDLRSFEAGKELIVASSIPVTYDPSLGCGKMSRW